MITSRDLDSLLTRLRNAGLRVGVEESLRAAHLLSQLVTSSSPEWLGEALRAVLAKSALQCDAFDEIFSEWAEELSAREEPEAEALRPRILVPSESPATRTSQTRPSLARRLLRLRRKLLIALAVLVVAALLLNRLWPHPVQPQTGQQDAGTTVPEVQDLGQATPQPQRVLAPSIRVEPSPLPTALYAGCATFLAALLVGAGLYFGLRRRTYLLPPAPEPTLPGPREIIPAPPKHGGSARLRLLDLRSQEALVWGIGRFVSEEPTRRLNIPATVVATAGAGGVPSLRFHRARHQREVWLWVDESARNPGCDYAALLEQLTKELVLSLRQGGLPVEQALYWGVPDRLTRLSDSDQPEAEFAPSEVEERREAALVVLLTDGRMLVDAHKSERFHDETRALLRQLSHFPSLSFCDVSRGQYGLQALVSEFELSVLEPEQVAKYLGGVPLDGKVAVGGPLFGDARLWAAACALSPYPLDEDTLFWVREELALSVPAAASVSIKGLAQAAGDRVQLVGSTRASLLNWLRQLSLSREVPLAQLTIALRKSRLGHCLSLWRTWLKDQDEQQRKKDADAPWVSTPAEQHLRMQEALLALWDAPVSATIALYGMWQGSLKDELSAQLQQRGPLELSSHQELIILPWRETELPPETQGYLRAMGFGGNRPRAVVVTQRPARLYLSWLGSAGLLLSGAVGIGVGILELRHPSGEPQVHSENAPPDARVQVQRKSEREYLITAVSAQSRKEANVPAGAQVVVSWEEEEREPLDGGTKAPPDMSGPPDLSSPTDLAEPADLAKPPDLLPPPWSCPYAEFREPKSGVVFVKVCGGDFQMGSDKTDKEAASDEMPAYPVHIDTFWIGKYEVSNKQYLAQKPGHKSTFDKNEELPVQNVNWNDARAYCLSIGGDLPTEAEWEYAARGRDGRRYPWGSGAPTADRAVYGQPYEKGPEPITAKPRGRGPFGTLNQAGNVWEWVADCYTDDRYKRRSAQSRKTDPPSAIQNPVDDRAECDARVVRGGAFGNVPRFLRSAVRVGDLSEGLNWDLGFRCVRGSRRQP